MLTLIRYVEDVVKALPVAYNVLQPYAVVCWLCAVEKLV